MTVVDKARTLARDAAEALDKRIRAVVGSIEDGIAELANLVDEAEHGAIHLALGYPTWKAYAADALQLAVKLPKVERAKIVGYLDGKGFTQREIADVIGVNQSTVQRDLVENGDANASPTQADPDVKSTVTDKSGKEHPKETTVIDRRGTAQPRRKKPAISTKQETVGQASSNGRTAPVKRTPPKPTPKPTGFVDYMQALDKIFQELEKDLTPKRRAMLVELLQKALNKYGKEK